VWGVQQGLTYWIVCTAVCWQLGILCGSVRGSAESSVLNRNLFFLYVVVIFVGRSGHSSHNRLLFLRKKASMMLGWGSSTLNITTDGIVGVSYCCMVLCCPVLLWAVLTDGRWNLAAHTATPWHVTTVAWCCRQNQDVLHPAERPPPAQQTSQWQWTASVFTTEHCKGSSYFMFLD